MTNIIAVEGVVVDVVASNERRDDGIVRVRIEETGLPRELDPMRVSVTGVPHATAGTRRQNVFVAYEQAKSLRLGMKARVVLEVED